ncbi:MAG: hypothetical protein AABY34_00085 [Pseudomonadota bacterium]
MPPKFKNTARARPQAPETTSALARAISAGAGSAAPGAIISWEQFLQNNLATMHQLIAECNKLEEVRRTRNEELTKLQQKPQENEARIFLLIKSLKEIDAYIIEKEKILENLPDTAFQYLRRNQYITIGTPEELLKKILVLFHKYSIELSLIKNDLGEPEPNLIFCFLSKLSGAITDIQLNDIVLRIVVDLMARKISMHEQLQTLIASSHEQSMRKPPCHRETLPIQPKDQALKKQLKSNSRYYRAWLELLSLDKYSTLRLLRDGHYDILRLRLYALNIFNANTISKEQDTRIQELLSLLSHNISLLEKHRELKLELNPLLEAFINPKSDFKIEDIFTALDNLTDRIRCHTSSRLADTRVLQTLQEEFQALLDKFREITVKEPIPHNPKKATSYAAQIKRTTTPSDDSSIAHSSNSPRHSL